MVVFKRHVRSDFIVMLDKIIGKSSSVREMRALIEKVAPTEATVLVLGESGTGKELVARAIHSCSDRADRAFIPVNCGAIPKDLLESELFGHKKGSFTGAISDRKGRFELANAGTIFLDEIGDMSMDLQVKLLRVLQDRQIDPVGSTKSVPVDVRVIAATHRNPLTLIQEGKFREDLYYRLNVIPIETPPLRERKGDIEELILHFAKIHAKKATAPITISDYSVGMLVNYEWPGNIRELSNLIDRFSALHPSTEIDLRQIMPSMVPMALRLNLEGTGREAAGRASWKMTRANESGETSQKWNSSDVEDGDYGPANEVEAAIMLAQGWDSFPEEGLELKKTLQEIEKNYIEQALTMSSGNVSKTARLLNIQRTTLIEKINRYSISSES